MGRRTEPRTAISFPVLVRGFNSEGNPFSVHAETHDVSTSGASLRGLNGLVQPGSKIEIELNGQSAWYRVQWVGGNGSRVGRVGVRCLERKYIWSVPAQPWEADTYNHAPPLADWVPPPTGWDGPERRAFPRRSCRIETQVSPADSSFRMPGKITDLSLGGCYVEMLSPLPANTNVELILALEHSGLHLKGIVRTSQTGLGMGVAFTDLTPAELDELRKFAPPAENPPVRAAGKVPRAPAQVQRQASASASPIQHQSKPAQSQSGPTASEAIDTVIRVLLHKGILTREELCAEFERLRAAKT